jgi:predicted ATPase
MNKLIVISGCSGGGKSTILSELSNQGYTVIEEVGRKLVKKQLAENSTTTPWMNPQDFCKLLIKQSIEEYSHAKKINIAKNNIIFFDRSFLEGISYFQSLKIHEYDHFIDELRYYPIIFITPPWEEIYTQDNERKHSFKDGVKEYNQLLNFYPKQGYKIIEIPKINVKERVKFIISNVNILDD